MQTEDSRLRGKGEGSIRTPKEGAGRGELNTGGGLVSGNRMDSSSSEGSEKGKVMLDRY